MVVYSDLNASELTVVGISAATELSLALVAFHVTANRNKASYAAKDPDLVVFTALTGLLANVVVALRYGWWGAMTEETEPAIGCVGEEWLLWLGVGGLFASAFLRVYRSHDVLVRHNGFMWPETLQIAVVMAPFLFPPLFFSGATSQLTFDGDSQECEPQNTGPEGFAFAVMVVLAVLTTAFTYRLQVVRFQAPDELTTASVTSMVFLFAILVLPILHTSQEEDRDERRKSMLVVSSLMTLALVAPPLWEPVKAYALAEDNEFETGDEFGFDRTLHPGEIQKISHDRMKVNALVSSPKAQDMPESSAMAWFFRDSLDRESIRDPLLLQASTMRILNKYILEEAPMRIPLTRACRKNIIRSKASSAAIFDAAREEIMKAMGGGSVTFCASPAQTVVSGQTPRSRDFSSGSSTLPRSSTQPSPTESEQPMISPLESGQQTPPSPSESGPPTPVVMPQLVQPLQRGTSTSVKANKSGGGQLKRYGLGGLGAGAVDLSTAFGIRQEEPTTPTPQPRAKGPRKIQVGRPPKNKKSNTAAVSGGQLNRQDVGNLHGTDELVSAFGLAPGNKQNSGFDEETPSRTVTQHVLGGRSSTGDTSRESDRTTPSKNNPQPQQEDYAMTPSDVAGEVPLDYLDPCTSCEEDSECSPPSMPGLMDRTKGELESGRRDNAQRNAKKHVERFESFLSGSDESDESQDDVPIKNLVFNPLFSEGAKKAASREKK